MSLTKVVDDRSQSGKSSGQSLPGSCSSLGAFKVPDPPQPPSAISTIPYPFIAHLLANLGFFPTNTSTTDTFYESCQTFLDMAKKKVEEPVAGPSKSGKQVKLLVDEAEFIRTRDAVSMIVFACCLSIREGITFINICMRHVATAV